MSSKAIHPIESRTSKLPIKNKDAHFVLSPRIFCRRETRSVRLYARPDPNKLMVTAKSCLYPSFVGLKSEIILTTSLQKSSLFRHLHIAFHRQTFPILQGKKNWKDSATHTTAIGLFRLQNQAKTLFIIDVVPYPVEQDKRLVLHTKDRTEVNDEP